MTRWTRTALVALAFAATAAATLAQTVMRDAPKDVKPAIIAVSATPPIITVDGTQDRFSPGVRIRDRNNMLTLTGGLAGQSLHTVYRRDSMGLVHEVWLLSPEEYDKIGGKYGSSADGYKRFAELLDLIWAARALYMLR
jgi:hypothetical protein